MAGLKMNRVQAGSPSWIVQERTCALQIAQSEAEEFTFSVGNEVDWLNEHMAEIFNANEVSVAEIFKTPGKLRGRTPKTVRKNYQLQQRPPLSSIFSTTSNARSSPSKHVSFEKPAPTFQVTEDNTVQDECIFHPKSNLETSSFPETVDSASGSIPLDEAQFKDVDPQPSRSSLSRSPSLLQINTEEPYESSRTNCENTSTSRCSPNQTEDISHSSRSPDTPKSQLHHASDEFSDHHIHNDYLGLDDKSLYPTLKLSESEELNILSSPVNLSPKISHQLIPSTESPIISQQDLPGLQVAESAKNKIGEINSPSDGSSPIRPIVRKSSLNFASLPAREPITKKSIGNRTSRTSHLEQSRASHFGRQTGGKSLDNTTSKPDNENKDNEQKEAIEDPCDNSETNMMLLHNKTSTQRLQDQISRLGRPQKIIRSSNTNINIAQAQVSQTNQPVNTTDLGQDEQVSVNQSSKSLLWDTHMEYDQSFTSHPETSDARIVNIAPPDNLKNQYIDIERCIDGNRARESLTNDKKQKEPGSHNFSINSENSTREQDDSLSSHHSNPNSNSTHSAPRVTEDCILENTKIKNLSHSISIPLDQISISSKPTKVYRDSPLKLAKDKFSSILKSSKVLFANTMATHTEQKLRTSPSDVMQNDLKNRNSIGEFTSNILDNQGVPQDLPTENEKELQPHQAVQTSHQINPPQINSTDQEGVSREEAQRCRQHAETKMSDKLESQIDKARLKVKENPHLRYIEQERVASLQTLSSSCRHHEKQLNSTQNVTTNSIWASPRKLKTHAECSKIPAATISASELPDDELESNDTCYRIAPGLMSSKSHVARTDKKRPLRPTKTTPIEKPLTFIRVDTGSQRGQQYIPSNTSQSTAFQESFSYQNSAPSHCLTHKTSLSSVQSKSSSTSLKSAATKTLEAAAKKKEKDEISASRKREAKLEIQRQRAKTRMEEQRKEEQKRRQQAESQLESQRERDKEIKISETKKTSSRQAIEKRRLELEKSKETRVARPNVRKKAIDESDKALSLAPRNETGPSKTQQDPLRTVCSTLNSGNKFPPKRLFHHDNEEQHSRSTLQRNVPAHQHHEQQIKRRKTGDSENLMDDSDDRPKITAPPIRQSGIRLKDMSTKPIFPNTYVNNYPSSSLQRSTLISQHTLNQSRAGHPMDIAQLAKGPIPFAPATSQGNSQNYKTPNPAAQNSLAKSNIKSVAKTVTRSSPRYQNGENIDLPEIPTDSDGDNSEDEAVGVRPGWTDTPEIHRQLAYQESIDPAEVFGQPGPLIMEEVFSKSKDRFHKFRARTSSANWSGSDKLTEDEIRRDLEGRDRVRRQGGWTYDAMV